MGTVGQRGVYCRFRVAKRSVECDCAHDIEPGGRAPARRRAGCSKRKYRAGVEDRCRCAPVRCARVLQVSKIVAGRLSTLTTHRSWPRQPRRTRRRGSRGFSVRRGEGRDGKRRSLPYGPRRRSTRSSVSNRATFSRAWDALLASSRTTRRSGRLLDSDRSSGLRRSPVLHPEANRRKLLAPGGHGPLTDTETPTTTGSREVDAHTCPLSLPSEPADSAAPDPSGSVLGNTEDTGGGEGCEQ